jgi:hypothetical protein
MGSEYLTVIVQCQAGCSGEDAPLRFRLGGRPVEVREVIDRWPGPGHRYFKVRGDDGGVYILRHDSGADRWDLTLFDSGARGATRLSST